MKTITFDAISDCVEKLCIESNYFLGQDVLDAFSRGLEGEASPTGRDVLNQLLDNARIAAEEQVPMCQDCGAAVVFLEVGQDVHIQGGSLTEAVSQGVARGYEKGYLRKSMCDPFSRKNTGNNLPAIIHTEIVPGEDLKITVAPKGGGSENMSAIAMLPPSAGLDGVKRFIIEQVRKAGPNPCPPILLGVGIGGNFETAALLAKKALLRPIGQRNPVAEMASLEKELLEAVNRLGIGPAGLGGRTTALNVAVEEMPCHIASLPVALNINCHAARHQSCVL